MANEFSRDFLIRIISDASSLKQNVEYAKREMRQLEDTAKSVGSKLGDIERVAKIDALGTEMGQLALKTKNVDEAVVQLTERLHQLGASGSEIDRATSAFTNAQAAASGTGGGGSSTSGLTALGTKIRNLPSTQIPGAGGLATDAIGNILRVLGALPPVALPAIAAIAAVGAAFAVMNKQLEEARATLKAALEASNAYYKAVQDLSTQQARDRVAELEKTNAALKAANEEQAAAAIAGVNSTTDSFGGLIDALSTLNVGIGQGAKALLLQSNGVTQTTDSINANSKEVEKNQLEIDRLTAGLNQNAFAANDAAEAEKALAAIRDQLADQTIARYKRDQDLLRNGTEQSVQALIDGLTDENAAIQQILDDVASGARNISPDKLKEYNDTLAKNNIDIQDLTKNIIGITRARDAEKQAIKDNEAALRDLDKISTDITNAESKRQSDIEAINQRAAESLDKLKNSYAEANREAGIRAQQEADKVGRVRADEDLRNALDLQFKLSKVDSDISEAAIKAEVDRQEALEKIRNEYNRSSGRAIQDRDAVALKAANDKRSDDLASAKKNYEKDTKQVEDNAEKKRKDILAEYEQARKLEALQRAAQDRERRIAEQNDSAARKRKYDADIQQLRAAQAADIAQRNNAYIKQINDLQSYLADYLAAHKDIYGEVLAYAKQLQSQLRGLAGGSGGSAGGGITGGVAAAPKLVPGAPGGSVTGGGNAGGFFGGAPASGLSIPITVNGMGKAGVIDTVTKELNATLRAAGYK